MKEVLKVVNSAVATEQVRAQNYEIKYQSSSAKVNIDSEELKLQSERLQSDPAENQTRSRKRVKIKPSSNIDRFANNRASCSNDRTT